MSLAAGQRLTLKTLRLQHQDLVWENAVPVEIVYSPKGVLQIQRLDLRSGSQAIRLQGTLDPQGVVQGEVQVQQLQLQPTVQAFAHPCCARRAPGSGADPGWHPAAAAGARPALAHCHTVAEAAARRHSGHHRAQRYDCTDRRALAGPGHSLLQVRGTMRLDAAVRSTCRSRRPWSTWTCWGLSVQPCSRALACSRSTCVTGTPQQPQVQGELLLRDGVLQLAATGERYQDIQARLIFAGDRVTIERLQLASRSGLLPGDGLVRACQPGPAPDRSGAVRAQLPLPCIHPPSWLWYQRISRPAALQEVTVAGSVTVPQARLRLEQIPGADRKSSSPGNSLLLVCTVLVPKPWAWEGTGRGAHLA